MIEKKALSKKITERNESLIRDNYSKKEATPYELFLVQLKSVIFGVLFIVLKSEEGNFWVEMIMLSTEVFQVCYYTFWPNYDYIWKNPFALTLCNFLNYFSLINMFQDSNNMYIIVFYILVFLVILVIVDIIYVSIVFSRNKIGAVWPIHLLRSVVSIIVTTLFMPIVEYFIGFMECTNINLAQNGLIMDHYVNNNINSITCYVGNFWIHATVGITMSIFFCTICIIVQTIFYDSKTKINQENAKTNSKADVLTLYVKIFLITGYTFFSFWQVYHWVLILFTFGMSFVLFYTYYTERPFYNEKMNKAYLIYTGIFLWNNIILLLGKILVNTNFNGCLELFFLGVPCVFILVLTEKNDQYSLLLANMSKFEKGETVITQIRYFLELVDKRDKERKSKLKLKGYVQYHVETCTRENCPLKKYLEELGKNEAVAYLYQHAQTMFQDAISKFNTCTPLRLSYAFFLMERMNNKKQSLLELMNAEKYDNSFEQQFIIYRFKKIIEEEDNANGGDADEGELDVVSAIAYKNHFVQFKIGVAKATELYTDFWFHLLHSTNETDDDMEKLNEFGSKINETLEIITINFNKMQKLRVNDVVLLVIYAAFVGDILNDKESAAVYQNRIEELADSKELEEDSLNKEESSNLIPNNDEYQYIILGAEGEEVGVISQISIGICTLFGYTKQEIIGKQIEFLMPEQYQKGHQMVLYEKIGDYKKMIASSLHKTSKSFKPITRDLMVYGKSKSRYLVPLSMKVCLMPSPDGAELYFMGRINPKETREDIEGIPNNHTQVCHVITNDKFIVQNFSANSINLLGLDNNSKGKIDITKMIKDFSEDFFKIEVEDKSPEQLFNAKQQFIISNYKSPSTIKWITTVLDGSTLDGVGIGGMGTGFSGKSKIGEETLKYKRTTSSGVINRTPIMRNTQKEEPFLLTTTEIFLSGKNEGFVFRLETVVSVNVSTNTTKKSLPNVKKENKFNFENSPTKSAIKLNKLASSSHNMIQVNPSNPANINISQINALKAFSANHRSNKRLAKIEFKKDDGLKIDQNFIPFMDSEFRLDSQNMTYITDPHNFAKIKEYIKEEAQKKYNFVKDAEMNKQLTTNGSNTDLSRSDSIVVEEDVMQDLGEEKKSFTNKSLPEIMKNTDYYTVEMNKIEFLIFDYKREEILEIRDYERQSQVEFKKSEDNKKEEKIQKHKKELEVNKEKKKLEDPQGEESTLTNNEIILIKSIEYALSKAETQSEVVRMRSTNMVIFIIMIVITAVLFFFFLTNQTELTGILGLIVNSYILISNSIMGVFYSRELVLLNNHKFSNFIAGDRSASINNMTQSLLSIFDNSYTLQSNILTSDLPLLAKANVLHQIVSMEVLLDNLNTKTVQLAFDSASIEALTSMYHLTNSNIDSLMPTDKDVYFFLRNSLNNLLLTMQGNANIYITGMKVNVAAKTNVFNLILIVMCVLCVIFFIAINWTHTMVVQRKASYMKVFFEIEEDVILKAIDRCTKFAKTLVRDDEADNESIISEADMAQDKEEETPANPLDILNPGAEESVDLKPVKKKNKKGGSNAETKAVTMQIFFVFSFVFIYYLLITLFYSNYLNSYVGYLNYYNITAGEQGYYLLAYNILREYFFDSNALIYNQKVGDVIEKNIDNNYFNKLERVNLLKTYFSTLPVDFQTFYGKIQASDLCYLAGDLFANPPLSDKQITCQSFDFNSTSYGLDILLTNYIEELRISKFNYDLLQIANQNRSYANAYNNTLYNSIFYNLSQTPNTDAYNTHDPFNIFNDQKLRDLGYINAYIINPAYESILTTLNASITTYMSLYKLIYMVLFIAFFTIVFYYYFFTWRPFEDHLNSTIFKTKKMLAIIPKEVLAGIQDISKLLDLGSNNSTVKKKKDPKKKN